MSGTLTSRAECEWFNTLTNVGLEAAKMPSTCVPNNHIFATLTNDHDWEMLEFGLQHVKSEKCFIDRLLVLCLDDKSFIKCKAAKFEHCVEYIKPFGASEATKDDYKRSRKFINRVDRMVERFLCIAIDRERLRD